MSDTFIIVFLNALFPGTREESNQKKRRRLQASAAFFCAKINSGIKSGRDISSACVLSKHYRYHSPILLDVSDNPHVVHPSAVEGFIDPKAVSLPMGHSRREAICAADTWL